MDVSGIALAKRGAKCHRRKQDILDGVDIRLMSDESLSGLSASNVPELGGCIASAGNKDVLIWAKRQAGWVMVPQMDNGQRGIYYWLILGRLPHHITSVIAELHNTDASLDVPEHAGHVAG
jgi:hypothetical protein